MHIFLSREQAFITIDKILKDICCWEKSFRFVGCCVAISILKHF